MQPVIIGEDFLQFSNLNNIAQLLFRFEMEKNACLLFTETSKTFIFEIWFLNFYEHHKKKKMHETQH